MFKSDGEMKYYKEFAFDYLSILDKNKDFAYHMTFNNSTNSTEKIEYCETPNAFDTEITSLKVYRKGVNYIQMLGINGWIYYTRTLEEFEDFYWMIVKRYDLRYDRRMIIYVENLGFDLSFIKNRFEWECIFPEGDRSPIYARTKQGVEFRDAYIQTGLSLRNIAKSCIKYPCKKLDGDLDYSLARHSKTPLTEIELGYCKADIRVLCNYYKEQIEKEGSIYNIPLTKTGYVRRDVLNKTVKANKHYLKFIHSLNISIDDYETLIYPAFAGGFTHCSNLMSCMNHYNVTHIDFSSSYPYHLLAYKYPCSSPIHDENIKTIEDMQSKRDVFGFIFTVEINGLSEKFFTEHYLSHSHCKYKVDGKYISNTLAEEKYVELDNGRIVTCSCTIETTITDIDWDIIEKVYDYDKENTKITNLVKFTMAYLPYEFIKCILEYYAKKTNLKDVPGVESEYAYYKSMLNSIYGFLVQKAIEDNVNDREEALNSYNSKRNRTVYFPWGVFCTAYSRRSLWGVDGFGILQLGSDYIYTDTDSIFFLNGDKYKKDIEDYNKLVLKRLSEMCKQYDISIEEVQPQNKFGKKKLIGIWSYEDDIEIFKSLGCKRYMCYIPTMNEKDRIELLDGSKTCLTMTVSGVNKKEAIPFLYECCNGNIEDCFDAFDDGLVVPAEWSGKLQPVYTDEEYTVEFTDYLGNTLEVTEKSGVYLDSGDYTLSITDDYIEFIEYHKYMLGMRED